MSLFQLSKKNTFLGGDPSGGGGNFQPENVVTVSDEQQLVDLGFLIDMPAPYDVLFPGGSKVYRIPDGTAVRATGGSVPISWPFYPNGNCEIGAVISGIDTFDMTGGTIQVSYLNDGNVCTQLFLTDCFLAAGAQLQDSRNGSAIRMDRVILLSPALGPLDNTVLFDAFDVEIGLAATGFVFTSNYENILLDKVRTTDNTFLLVTGTMFSLNAVTTGARVMRAHNCTLNGAVNGANMISVADDTNIQAGVIVGSFLNKIANDPTFITGIDALTSANTEFFANTNITNTPAGGIYSSSGSLSGDTVVDGQNFSLSFTNSNGIGIGGMSHSAAILNVIGKPAESFFLRFIHSPDGARSITNIIHNSDSATSNIAEWNWKLKDDGETSRDAFGIEVSLSDITAGSFRGRCNFRIAAGGSLTTGMRLEGGALLHLTATFSGNNDTASMGFLTAYTFTGTGTPRTLTINSADIARVTATLPWRFSVTDQGGDCTANPLTIVGEGGELFNGDAEGVLLGGDFASIILESNGTAVSVIGRT